MAVTVRLLIVLALGLGACASELPRDAVIKGELETTRLAEIGELDTLALGPAEGKAPVPALEEALRTSLERRRVAVTDGAPFTLRYLYVGTPTTIEDPDLGVGLAGSVGSSSGGSLGIGIELPIFGLFERDRGVAGTAFDLALTLEDGAGRALWRGWTRGLSRAVTPGALARPLVPLLLERLGEDTPRRRFLR